MKKLRVVTDFLLVFVVGAILYVCFVGGALYRNVRNELRKRH